MSTVTTHNFTIVTTKKGKSSLKVRFDNGLEKTLHSLYDPEKEAGDIVGAFQFDGKGVLVVLGLGLGYHLSELVRRSPETPV